MRQLILLHLSVPLFLLAACTTKIVNPPAPQVKDSPWGCKVPINAVITTDKANLELAAVNYRDISVKGVKVANDPSVLPLLSEAARDAESRDYLRCLATNRDKFTNEEVIYLDSVNAFLATRPTADEFIKWQKVNPTPRAKKDEEDLRKRDAEAAAAAADKKACLSREFQKCKTNVRAPYGTYNQVCDDERTHYLVRRINKVEMDVCYSVPNYNDCVGGCFPRGEAVINEVCRRDAAGNCD